METRVVNKYKESFQIYIGRGSIWGNPFAIGKDGDREEVIIKFEEYLLNNRELQEKVFSLKGKTLGCFCKPAACHGDILKKYADKS